MRKNLKGMGLFSLLFSKNKKFCSTEQVEALRESFCKNEALFMKVEQSSELKRYQELKEKVNSPLFQRKRKEIEALSYKNSDCYKAEKKYKALLKSHKVQSYLLIRDSQELQKYEQVKLTEEYQEYIRLKTIIQGPGFDKKLHKDEYAAYKKIIESSKIATLIKFESLKRFREFCEVKNSKLSQEYEQLSTFVQSDEFKHDKKFLLDKKRYQTTEDYKLLEEYKRLEKNADIIKYYALLEDTVFKHLFKWKLVFEDDFNQAHLDNTKWLTRYYAGERFLNDTYGVGREVQLCVPDNITLKNSNVHLYFRKESIMGKYWDQQVGIRERKYDYTSAMISTALSFRQCYGRFEAKVKVNPCDVTSCFWMLGDTDVPHVEIMKCQANGVSVGRVCADKTMVQPDVRILEKMKLKNDYYIFTLEWTAEKMVWLVNDLVVKEVHENIPNVPMYIIFSLGANENPADKGLPVQMEIDWVRGFAMKE